MVGMNKIFKRLAALFCLLFAFGAKADEVCVYMINVGKGDAILVLAEGRTYLIDSGKASAEDSVKAALKRFNITRLNGVFVTHTDKDHSGGLKWLAKSDIEIDAWYAPAFYAPLKKDHPAVSAAAKRKELVSWLRAGDCVDDMFYVLAPLVKDEENEDNNSLVLMFKTQYGSMLFAGDIESEAEERLAESGADIKCDVLKVPKHGDGDSCGEALVKLTSPKYALISTDPYEKPGTPDPEVIDRLTENGAEVFRTDFSTDGILVTFSENGISCEYD